AFAWSDVGSAVRTAALCGLHGRPYATFCWPSAPGASNLRAFLPYLLEGAPSYDSTLPACSRNRFISRPYAAAGSANAASCRGLAPVARPARRRDLDRDERPAQVEPDREYRLENADRRPRLLVADHLGRPHLSDHLPRERVEARDALPRSRQRQGPL